MIRVYLQVGNIAHVFLFFFFFVNTLLCRVASQLYLNYDLFFYSIWYVLVYQV